jgi:hypothetical protein
MQSTLNVATLTLNVALALTLNVATLTLNVAKNRLTLNVAMDQKAVARGMTVVAISSQAVAKGAILILCTKRRLLRAEGCLHWTLGWFVGIQMYVEGCYVSTCGCYEVKGLESFRYRNGPI